MTANALPLHVRPNGDRRQLPEEVAAYVRELIFSGAVRPGEFLRMERIAESVGVSNTPVREGLLALSNEGFIRQIPRRGFVVATFTQRDIHDLFWAQALFAGELAARAATKMTRAQVDKLDEIVKAYDVAVAAGDSQAVTDLGHEFHRDINLAADSIRLAMLLGSAVKTLPLDFYSTIEGWVEASHDEHPQIVDALRKRAPKKVRTLMQRHISHGGDRLIHTLEQRGLWNHTPSS